jgi:hypothetical protein
MGDGMRIFFYAACVCLVFLSSVFADESGYKWELKKSDGGIDVYVSETPGSGFKTYKAECLIEKSWEVLFEVLLDVPCYPTWMPGCIQSSIVKMIHEDPIKGNFIIHLAWDAIWPVRNRDLVVEVQSEHDWDNDHVFIVLKGTDKVPVPVPEGLVRLKDFYARFDFRYVDKNRTAVTFITMVDPGGAVPSGVADIQTSTVPAETLKGLSRSAENPKYLKQAVMDYY